MTNTTARATKTALHDIFSRNGLPETLVATVLLRMPQFCIEPQQLPSHPQLSGQTEFKVCHRTSPFVIVFIVGVSNTTHCTTGEPPSLLLLGRRMRTRLDLYLASPAEKHNGEARASSVLW